MIQHAGLLQFMIVYDSLWHSVTPSRASDEVDSHLEEIWLHPYWPANGNDGSVIPLQGFCI